MLDQKQRQHKMASRIGHVSPSAFLLALLSASLLLQTCSSAFTTDEDNLRTALLGSYNTKVRPDITTNVSAWITLNSLIKMDISGQTMSLGMVLRIQWTDSRLAWTPASHGGIKYVVTAPEDIWTPPLVINNAVENLGVIGGKDRDGAPLRIWSTGDVYWFPPLTSSTACDMTIAQYPFDTQECSIDFVGWTYPVDELDLQWPAAPVDTATMYTENGEFDLIRTGGHETLIYAVPQAVATPSDTYKTVSFDLTFRRKWQFYGQNLLLPIVLNSILMNAVFLLPIESGEKMGYSLTVLLSYIVFLTWVTDNLPPVSTDTSILQVYLAVVLCMGVTATLLTTWVMHLYHSPLDKPVGACFRRTASKVLVPFCALLSCRKTPRSKDAQLSAQKEADGGGFGPRRHKLTMVQPLPPADTDFGREVKCMPGFEEEEAGGRGGGGEGGGGEGGVDLTLEQEKTTFTWQELAVLFDKFFMWVFSFLLIIVTTVVMSLLYGHY